MAKFQNSLLIPFLYILHQSVPIYHIIRENDVKKLVGGFIILLLLTIVTIVGLIAVGGDTILKQQAASFNMSFLFGLVKFSKTFPGPEEVPTLGTQELSATDIAAITIVIFALMTLLLFVNLKRIKIGPYEIERLPADTGPVGPQKDLTRKPLLASPT